MLIQQENCAQMVGLIKMPVGARVVLGQDHIMLDFDWGRVTKIVGLWPSFGCCCLCLLILLNMFDFVGVFRFIAVRD